MFAGSAQSFTAKNGIRTSAVPTPPTADPGFQSDLVAIVPAMYLPYPQAPFTGAGMSGENTAKGVMLRTINFSGTT
jgi:hypothetical protein